MQIDTAVNLYNMEEYIYEGLLTRIFHVPLPGISVCSHKKYIIFLSLLVGALGVLHSKELQRGLRQSVAYNHLYTAAYALSSVLRYM